MPKFILSSPRGCELGDVLEAADQSRNLRLGDPNELRDGPDARNIEMCNF